MRFYTRQHQYYCGIDLHARKMYVCLLDRDGQVRLHRNLDAGPRAFLKAVAAFRDDLVVAAECMFSWYWLADVCAAEGIDFVLGHALYMKAIHGGKSKNDRIDSEKIARLLRGGNLPMAYVYPQAMRATRDLCRRRSYLVHFRGELLAHVTNTNTQYNLPRFEKKLSYKANRDGVTDRFAEAGARTSMDVNLELIGHLDRLIGRVQLQLTRTAKIDDPLGYQLLQSVPGIGEVLALVLLYEIHDIRRFDTVGRFLSYCRLVRPKHESCGKTSRGPGGKFGNAHLKWAFGEATVLMIRELPWAKRFIDRQLTKKVAKAKALNMLAKKLARTVHFILRRREPFDVTRFTAN